MRCIFTIQVIISMVLVRNYWQLDVTLRTNYVLLSICLVHAYSGRYVVRRTTYNEVLLIHMRWETWGCC